MATNAATMQAIGLKISAIDDYSKTLATVSKNLKGLSKLAEDTQPKLSFGGFDASKISSFNSMSNTAVGGFDKIRKAAGFAAQGVGSFVPALAGLGAVGVGVGVVGGLAKVVTGWQDAGTQLNLASQRLNIPVEKLSALQNIAAIHGASADDMTSGLAGLQNTMSDAVYGRNDQAANLFHGLGIDIGNVKDGVKDVASELPQIADETQKMFKVDPHAALRFLDAVGVGQQLLPIFKDGSEGLARYNAEAIRMGVITKAQADAAQALAVEQNKLQIAVTQTAYSFAAEVGPTLIPLLKEFTGYLTDPKNQQEMKAFFQEIGADIRDFTKPEHLHQVGDEIKYITGEVGDLKIAVEALGSLWLVKKLFGAAGAVPAVVRTARAVGPGVAAATRAAAPLAFLALTGPAGGEDPDFSKQKNDEYLRSQAVAVSPKMLPLMEDAAAAKYGVPIEFARSIFKNEHGFKADGSAAISPAGAIGGGQLMPGTAADLGVNPFDAAQNIDGSVRYMKQQLDHFGGDPAAAAAAYNAGPNSAAVKFFAQNHDASVLPKETQAYLRMMSDGALHDAPAAAEPYHRMMSDAKAPAPASDTAAPYADRSAAPAPAQANPARVQIDVNHTNPPAGVQMRVTSVDPSVSVGQPRVVRSMPDGRDVERDGY